ncbi:MAG: GTPase Era [Pseudomonadota bacterium]|nr:GTPase Era [Pseudomonadota bacterium]HBP15106.1 GTPase Era [Gammaproteobacteria bacterium]HCP50538.1 GTPase Era [Gammaproteobacteria bacterium]
MTNPRCGYAGIVGRPNVGKSTLLNHLMGTKLSITSRKPQTTRINLLGISTRGQTQIIFVDTPGLRDLRPDPSGRKINRYMSNQAMAAVADVDLAVLLVDARGWTEADEAVLALIKREGVAAICGINKIDRLARKDVLLPLMKEIHDKYAFEAIIPMSALHRRGLDDLSAEIAGLMPDGPHLFDSDALTDRPLVFLVAEAIREKLMRQLGDELPHRTTVVVERYDVGAVITEIDAVIYVERQSQKAIVIGRGGKRLKAIGQEARGNIEDLAGGKVMLNLWVKVQPGWSNNDELLARFGYR